MEWLARLFEKYPEMGVYLAIGIGYLIARIKFRGVGLGTVTCSLLAGIFVGNFFHVPVSDQAKALLFLLFLFAIGYSVGPSFFRNLKGEGWRWALLAIWVPVVGLVTAYAVARFLKLDPGFSAGLLSGSLTESPVIGTASEAIRGLSLPDDQKQILIGHIAVADAICYLFGTIGVIWVCSSLGPKLLGIDLRSESKTLEASLGIKRSKFGVSSGWQPVGIRAYTIAQDAPIIGKTVAAAEKSVPGARLFVERIRRNNEVFSATGAAVLEAGDTVAVLGRTEVLVKVLGPKSSEVPDPELLEIPVASFDLYVTSQEVAGKTLRQFIETFDETRGVLLRGITRSEKSIPIGANIVVERGDILHVTGVEEAVEKLAPIVGMKLSPVEEADFSTLGIAIFIGILSGALITLPVGHLRISLGTSVGTLLSGLIVGWAQSVRPWFGRMPNAAISFMKSIGLSAFVAMIGLKAGPIFVHTLKQSGYILFLGGIVVTLTPLITGLYFGRYILKLNPVLLLGGLAGAQTMIAGVAAVQDKSDSSVSTLGYSYTAAIGHILLTTWGTVIVYLMT
jgi:putative transport protein